MNQLIYIPAVSVGALFAAMKNNLTFRNGKTVRFYHRDFFEDIRYPYFLITGGHYYKKPSIVQEVGLRDSGDEFIFGDSGGFQIATGAIKYNEDVKIGIFNWLENNSTVAANLDIPPFGTYGFKDALDISLINFEYFATNQSGKTKYLNVLQGKNLPEMLIWYNEVKHYKFDGWAINVKGNSFEKILCAMSILLENKEFNSNSLRYLHFFGTSKIDDVILISELQHNFNKNGLNVQITIDSSSPCAARFGSYYYGYNFKTNIFNTLHYPKIDNEKESHELFPKHTLGDYKQEIQELTNIFIQNPSNPFDKYLPELFSIENVLEWNTTINSLVTIHNIYEIVQLVKNVNTIIKYPSYIKQQLFSADVISILRLLPLILFSTDASPIEKFKEYQYTLHKLSRNAPISNNTSLNKFF